MIVIAEYRPNTFWSVERRKSFSTRFDVSSVGCGVIAGEYKHVGRGLLGKCNNASHVFNPEDVAVVNVGELSYAKTFEPFW